jgi:hypothetical protein
VGVVQDESGTECHSLLKGNLTSPNYIGKQHATVLKFTNEHMSRDHMLTQLMLRQQVASKMHT